jgi:hypothetical protein
MADFAEASATADSKCCRGVAVDPDAEWESEVTREALNAKTLRDSRSNAVEFGLA